MLRRALLAAVAVLGLAAAPAHAAPPTVVGFDDLPAFSFVGDHYAAQGVTFGHPLRFGITTEPDVCHDPQGNESLEVLPNGITGQDAGIGCGTGDAFNTYSLAFHYDVERRGVSFDLLSPNYNQLAGGNYGAATVKLWGVGRVLLGQQDVNLPVNVPVHLAYTRPGPDIVTVTITGGGGKAAGVDIDNIVAPLDDVPPPPKFEIGLVQPSIDVVEGASATAHVSVLRYNGSSGGITINTGALPAGLASAVVTPNPVTGIAPAELTIRADSPLAGDRQLSVSASGGGSAGTFVGGGLVQNVHALSAIVAGSALTSVTPGCGDRSYALTFQVRGDYHGPVFSDITSTGPIHVDQDGGDPVAVGDGTLALNLKLHQDYSSQLGESDIAITLRPAGATPIKVNLHTRPENVDIVDTQPQFAIMPETFPSDQTARSVVRSDRITITGYFPQGCSITVTDPLGTVLGVTQRVDSSPGFPGKLVVRLDDDPVSGQLALQNTTTGVTFRHTPFLELRTFRNLAGLPQVNSDPNAGGDYSWSDFIRTFGSDDADWCAGPLGCVRDPIAVMYWHGFRDKMASQAGMCFGYATMALRFDRGIELPTEYNPKAKRGWDVGPFFEGSSIKNAVMRWQVSQNDKHYVDDREFHGQSETDFFNAVRDALRSDDAAYILLHQGSAGHAIVVYDMKVNDDGSFDLLTYNSNAPYSTTEESDAGVHASNLARSKVHVDHGVWSGGITNWKGGMDSIKLLDKLPPSDADLPFDLPWATVAGLILADKGSASAAQAGAGAPQPLISQIAVGGTGALGPDGTPAARSGIREAIEPTGIKGSVQYGLTPGHSYDLTVTGTGNGAYEQSLLGAGSGVMVSGARTTTGQDDHVVVTPGKPHLRFASAAPATPATLDVDTRLPGGITHTASAELTAGRGRSDDVAFSADRKTLDLRHTGGATGVALTLGSVGEGAPGSVRLATLRVGAGQRLSLKPAAWSDLNAGVSYVVRDAKGRVVRSGRARIKAPAAVRLAGRVSAKVRRTGKGATVTVSGRVARPSATPLLTAVVQVVRNGRVARIGAATLRGADKVKAGRFTLPVSVKRLAHGAKLRITVALTDEGADLATVRRTGTARG